MACAYASCVKDMDQTMSKQWYTAPPTMHESLLKLVFNIMHTWLETHCRKERKMLKFLQISNIKKLLEQSEGVSKQQQWKCVS